MKKWQESVRQFIERAVDREKGDRRSRVTDRHCSIVFRTTGNDELCAQMVMPSTITTLVVRWVPSGSEFCAFIEEHRREYHDSSSTEIASALAKKPEIALMEAASRANILIEMNHATQE